MPYFTRQLSEKRKRLSKRKKIYSAFEKNTIQSCSRQYMVNLTFIIIVLFGVGIGIGIGIETFCFYLSSSINATDALDIVWKDFSSVPDNGLSRNSPDPQ